jgi:hypothetical protein
MRFILQVSLLFSCIFFLKNLYYSKTIQIFLFKFFLHVFSFSQFFRIKTNYEYIKLFISTNYRHISDRLLMSKVRNKCGLSLIYDLCILTLPAKNQVIQYLFLCSFMELVQFFCIYFTLNIVQN